MGLDSVTDDGTTLLSEEDRIALRIPTIETKAELNEFEQQNIEKAVTWTLRKKFRKENLITEEFIKELHFRMFNDTWKWAGQFRKSDTNLGIHWTKIGTELRQLLDDTNYWIEKQSYAEDEIAVRLKHRIVVIHCFPNGNGRHSRLFADVVAQNVFGNPAFSWGSKSLIAAGDARARYLSALREADKGDIHSLIAFARS